MKYSDCSINNTNIEKLGVVKDVVEKQQLSSTQVGRMNTPEKKNIMEKSNEEQTQLKEHHTMDNPILKELPKQKDCSINYNTNIESWGKR